MTPSELAQIVEIVRAQPSPRPEYLDPKKAMVAIGAAACSFVAWNLNQKVDTSLAGIAQLTEVANRLLILQEGDTKELNKRGEWMDEVNKDRKDISVRLNGLEVRVGALEDQVGKRAPSPR